MKRALILFVVLPAIVVLASPARPGTAEDGAEADQHEVVAVSASGPTCALFDNGHVKCWGDNPFGELGLGDLRTRGDGPGEMGEQLVTVDLGRDRTATEIVTLGLNACALLDNGRVACWGEGSAGVLGQGNSNDRGSSPRDMGDGLLTVPLGTGRTATAIAAGPAHVCAVLDTGQVKCWGANGWGQLGLGDSDFRGDGPGEMGNALPPVDLGTGRTAVEITAGQAHTCALLDNDHVKCWGATDDGQSGTGSPGDAIGDEPGEMGDALPPVDLGTGRTVHAVSAGSLHTCALLDDHQLKCWGYNYGGELGLGDSAARGDDPGEMGDALPAIDLGAGRAAVAVSAGSHTCAVLDNGSVKCWGAGYSGLGLGDTETLGDEPGEMGDALPAVDLGTGRSATAVDAGPTTCVVLDEGMVKCWGLNQNGALGLGDEEDRGDEPGEMGDALPTVALGTGEPPPRKVDIEIRRSDRSVYVGNDVYGTTGANQSITANVRRGRTVAFVVRVRNESAVPDTLRVQGGRASGRFTVKYYSGGIQTLPSFRLLDWPPNYPDTWTVRITAAPNAVLGSTMPVNISVTSTRDPSKRDVVRAIARVVR